MKYRFIDFKYLEIRAESARDVLDLERWIKENLLSNTAPPIVIKMKKETKHVWVEMVSSDGE